MDRLQRAAIVIELAEAMNTEGSRRGRTQYQKSIYVLQHGLGVPTEYSYILYKHGPFSFDLRDELTVLRADGLLSFEARPEPSGPSLVPTSAGLELRDRYPKTLAAFAPQIRWVARNISARTVNELEGLTTALFVLSDRGQVRAEEIAEEIIELRPYIALTDALQAAEEMTLLLASAPKVAEAA